MGLLQGEKLGDCRLHHFHHHLSAPEVAPTIEKGKGEEFTMTESAIRTGGMTSIGGRVVVVGA